MTRNPYDACVSHYYHAWSPYRSGWPFNAWARTWLRADEWAPYGSWFAWHRAWRAAADARPAQILSLRYEDAVDHPVAAAEKLLRFLGKPPGLAAKVARGASFTRVRKAAEAAKAAAPDRANAVGHLRQGKVGGWRSHFAADPALRGLFVDAFRTQMAGVDASWPIGEGEGIGPAPA